MLNKDWLNDQREFEKSFARTERNFWRLFGFAVLINLAVLAFVATVIVLVLAHFGIL